MDYCLGLPSPLEELSDSSFDSLASLDVGQRREQAQQSRYP
jgi:hypothetical protein